VWLHLKGQEDAMSGGDCADDEEVDAGGDGCEIETNVNGRAAVNLDKTEIAVFDNLTSAPANDITMTAISNVELLSSVNAVLTDAKDCDDNDDLDFEEILAAGRLEHATSNGNESIFTRSMTSSMTNDCELSMSDSFMRPRTGSVIESGRGDLIASPVRTSASNISLPRIPSLLRAGASLAKAKLSLPWKSGGSMTGLSDGQTEYIIEAADLISQAQEHELVGSYQAAFSKYKSGIGILLKGVQSKIIIVLVKAV
jgi:hypothetical protein